MIVTELIKYAQRNGLGIPGFAPKTAKYALLCNTSIGNTPAEKDFSVTVLGDPDDQKNTGLMFESCPETPGMNSGGKSHVLLETLDVVFGINKTILEESDHKTDDEKKKEIALLEKHNFFVESLVQMSQVLPEAAHFVSFLKDRVFCQKMYLDLMNSHKAKVSDKITLMANSIETGNEVFLVNEGRWRPWWVDYRKTTGKGNSPFDTVDSDKIEKSEHKTEETKKKATKEKTPILMVSLATGEITEPTPTHPKITELSDVGASSMGASFIGFDKASLQSFGLDKSANAAMNEESASEYRAALNNIFKTRSKKFGSVKIGYWYNMPVDQGDDPVSMIEGKDEEDSDIRDELNAAQKLLESWEKGEKSRPLDNSYHSLILSGNAGRIMIRDWQSGNLIDWVQAAADWFSCTEIVRRDGSGILRQHKFYAIASSFFSSELKKSKDQTKIWGAKSPTIVALWKAAFNKQIGIPENAVLSALREIKIDMYGNSEGNAIPANHARMGLLRAYLVRNHGDKNMKPYLNEDHPDVAYQCGRLMSLIADLQYSALGDVNAGIVQRFYSSASVTPQLVFGRMMRMCQFYIAKAESAKAGAIEKRIADVWGKITKDIPATFSLKQQTLFAEGYYQEQAKRRNDIAEAKAEKVEK